MSGDSGTQADDFTGGDFASHGRSSVSHQRHRCVRCETVALKYVCHSESSKSPIAHSRTVTESGTPDVVPWQAPPPSPPRRQYDVSNMNQVPISALDDCIQAAHLIGPRIHRPHSRRPPPSLVSAFSVLAIDCPPRPIEPRPPPPSSPSARQSTRSALLAESGYYSRKGASHSFGARNRDSDGHSGIPHPSERYVPRKQP